MKPCKPSERLCSAAFESTSPGLVESLPQADSIDVAHNRSAGNARAFEKIIVHQPQKGSCRREYVYAEHVGVDARQLRCQREN